MSERIPAHQLDAQGINTGATIHWNLTTAPLVEQAIARGEGKLTKDGALLVDTGKFTGRSVKDKYVVRDASGLYISQQSRSKRPGAPLFRCGALAIALS